ncbi:hypothetical protein DSO57_1021446 [Entomophthora muscae]|uniref:Uncharacterized protein n=1 Tax=Entomophthora muscae TaxID=34485 RepID=A0ACC2ST20_9FUNG|nr:hypothetical protein DSO57_1021446 [Entomophthora muscae]
MDEATCDYINRLTLDDLKNEPELAEEISAYQEKLEIEKEKFNDPQFFIKPAETSLLDILLVFTSLHGDRVSWFKSLDSYFKQYLSNEISHDDYTSKNLELTKKQKLFFHQSKTLISNLKNPATYNRCDVALEIEEILKHEVELLKQTASYQTAKVMTEKTEKDYSQEAKEASERIPEIREQIASKLMDLHQIMASLE